MCDEFVLDNGVRVIAEYIPHFPSVSVGLWIGAGSIILPGVTIGENSVIGAGSVVTHDILANVVAVGVPCRVLREITEQDNKYYRGGQKIDISLS